jgi:uncharacterized protein with HEPN domain
MPRDDRIYLRHILDAIAKTEQYLLGIDEDTFKQETLVQDGVIRQIQIIGEAVRHISDDLRNQYPHIPWQDIAGMRNKLVHDYFGVDIDEVWLAAKNDVPPLKNDVMRILEKM